MLQAIISYIDRTTMYRLVLYYLTALYVVAVLFSAVGVLPYAPLDLVWSLVVILIASWVVNTACARIVKTVTNVESVYITAFILAFIMPSVSFTDPANAALLGAVAAIAMVSKYLIAPLRKHLFNPAALGAAVATPLLGMSATWWVAGNFPLLPFILIGGIAVVHKLRKSDLVISFAVAALITTVVISANPVASLQATLQYSAIFFFAFVMLTEPLTMPPTRGLRIAYGALVGVLFIWAPTVGPLFISTELALLVGNFFSYVVSPKGRYMLSFVERRPLANGIFEYLFKLDKPISFASGQYLEWTLGGVEPDTRGNRRFFTIASAPEDTLLALGVRFYEKPSAFKRRLSALPSGGVATVSSLGGDFTMPKDTNRKLAFLAGGIGVTPFASMARHIHKRGENRDAVLLYSVKNDDEIAYKDVFGEALQHGLRTKYVVKDILTAERISQEVPDYSERLFYVSGPPGMVNAMKSALLSLGVSRLNIKTDFFPGLA
jgi:ferredoxin-NADP reductase/Na+-translocating ferredoxin:NAD+ oxidoreductase RnfD subunit